MDTTQTYVCASCGLECDELHFDRLDSGECEHCLAEHYSEMERECAEEEMNR